MSQNREHPDFEVLSDLFDGYLDAGRMPTSFRSIYRYVVPAPRPTNRSQAL